MNYSWRGGGPKAPNIIFNKVLPIIYIYIYIFFFLRSEHGLPLLKGWKIIKYFRSMRSTTNLISGTHSYVKGRNAHLWYGILGVSNNYPSSLCNILDALKILLPQLISQVLSNAMYTNYFIIFFTN